VKVLYDAAREGRGGPHAEDAEAGEQFVVWDGTDLKKPVLVVE